MSIKEIENENDLDHILRENKSVFVLFYSSWCPFCRSFLPIFNKNAQNREDKKFLRVKIDRFLNPIWEKYSVNVVPTVILFQGNKAHRRLDGVLGVGIKEKEFNCFLDSSS